MPGLQSWAIAAESRRLRVAVSLLGGGMLALCHASLWMGSRSSLCSSLQAMLDIVKPTTCAVYNACEATMPSIHCTDGFLESRQWLMHSRCCRGELTPVRASGSHWRALAGRWQGMAQRGL